MELEPKQELPRRKDLERYKKIKAILLRLYSLPNGTDILDEVVTFAERLGKKYDDARKYAIFHDLISSGVGMDVEAEYPQIIYTDFTGDGDSVVEFLDGLDRKYK